MADMLVAYGELAAVTMLTYCVIGWAVVFVWRFSSARGREILRCARDDGSGKKHLKSSPAARRRASTLPIGRGEAPGFFATSERCAARMTTKKNSNVVNEVPHLSSSLCTVLPATPLRGFRRPLIDKDLPSIAGLTVLGDRAMRFSSEYESSFIAGLRGAMSVQERHRRERHARGQAILTAAAKVFAKHGLEGATIEMVAREAEVAVGTIYLYYSSRDDLYLNLIADRDDTSARALSGDF